MQKLLQTIHQHNQQLIPDPDLNPCKHISTYIKTIVPIGVRSDT